MRTVMYGNREAAPKAVLKPQRQPKTTYDDLSELISILNWRSRSRWSDLFKPSIMSRTTNKNRLAVHQRAVSMVLDHPMQHEIWWTATRSDKMQSYQFDNVKRRINAPALNTLRVTELVYIMAWQSFVYAKSVISTFAHRFTAYALHYDFKRRKLND